MIDTMRSLRPMVGQSSAQLRPAIVVPVIVDGARLERELRVLAADMAGRLDRDELSRSDESLVEEAIEAAVLAALPVVLEIMDRELTPRLESLPLGARLTLARARTRSDFGLD